MPKIDVTRVLKDLTIPLISLSIILSLYFIFISPYLTLKNEFELGKVTTSNLITSLESKKTILINTRKESEILKAFEKRLNSLVPSDSNVSDLVGVLDTLSRSSNFIAVEENKNVVSPENTKKRINEVIFNGKTLGMTSAVKFLSSINDYPTKIFNLYRLEIHNNFDEKFTRISFNALSSYNPDKATFSVDSPVDDFLNNKNFMDTMEVLTSKK